MAYIQDWSFALWSHGRFAREDMLLHISGESKSS